MEKRLVVAVVLTVIVLFGYPYVMRRMYPAKPAPVRTEETAAVETAGGALEAAAGAETAQEKQAKKVKRPVRPPVNETLTTVETPLFKAVFTNAGGAVKSWELKKFRETKEPDSPIVNLAKTPDGEPTNYTAVTSDGKTEQILFKPSATSIAITQGQSAELVYTGTTGSGLTVVKKYSISADNYTVVTNVTVQNPSETPASGHLDTVLTSGFTSNGGKGRARYHAGPLIKTSKDFKRQKADQYIEKGREVVSWIGLEDKYFLDAIIPDDPGVVTWITENVSKDLSRATLQTDLNLPPGGEASYGYRSFMGPKEYDILVAHNAGLGEAIEFGFFSFMAKPLLVVLNFFQRIFVNYGIAIIIVTVIIKLIFYPLTKHSLSSMKQMQRVQPQLAAIKEKYKDNKEKMNKELMELYKKNKINPVGGCLPMILQIPVFIALYEVLYVAIELRHAPLFLWITDLSAKDPYYITPLLMGATMFLQQKMTPSSVDPSQAKIMMLMPVVFTFMFLNFPSGLVLYWLVNNILSIGQQYLIYRSPAKA